jgi:hypothetical protein
MLSTTDQIHPGDVQEVSFNVQLAGRESFSVQPQSGSIPPGTTITLHVALDASLVGAVKARVPVSINGLFNLHLEVKANVVLRRLILANPALQTLALGAVSVGKSRRERVEVVNKGSIPVDADFSVCLSALKDHGVHIDPDHVTLVAKQRKHIQVTYRPQTRCKTFTADLCPTVSGLQQRLLTVTGSGLGMDARLDSNSLPFGTVAFGSQTTRTVRLINTGALSVHTMFSHALLPV